MRNSIALKNTLWILLLLGIAACTPVAMVGPQPTTTPTAALTIPPTQTPTPQPSSIPTDTLTPTLNAPEICSPLEGIALVDLAEIVVNPYAPPPMGSDQPHQGIDLAQLDPTTRIALKGLPVHAVMAGDVVMVLNDRFPYGNAVLVKVPLESVPAGWLEGLALPEAMPTLSAPPALTCPQPEAPPNWDNSRRALYILYAHLQEAPTIQVGEAISCGQGLGTIGDSGNALNPHLHVEIRVGPADATLGNMAHYDNSATPAEMTAYCQWRVSGWFQPINPLELLENK
ncbi:MAG TPA: M23 family metallopeptidase [Anaerolineaceae bacterium]|nr:M23 family metallopeptidase [Anaerolineaceae bacterium]